MRKLQSFLYLASIGILVLFYAFTIAVCAVLPHRYRFAIARNYASLMSRLLKLFCNVDMKVEGKESLPNEPCVVLIKHSSPWETLAQFLVFPPHAIVLKHELMWIPVFGWALASLKSIAINRKTGRSAVKQILDQGKQRLEEGIWVVIFPEGTRVRKGKLGRFGAGGALLACEAKVPVIPVAHNAADHWPNGELVKHPGTITLRIGPQIDTTGKTPEQVTEEARLWIDTAMKELSATHLQEFNTSTTTNVQALSGSE